MHGNALTANTGDAIVLLPNMGPGVGASILYRKEIGFTLGLPVRRWEGRAMDRGQTTGYHLQLHRTFKWGVVDGYYSNLKGFFIDKIRIGSAKAINDVIVNGDRKTYEKRPGLSYQSINISGQWLLWDESGVSTQHLTVNQVGGGLAWTPAIAGDIGASNLKYAEPIISKDDAPRFGNSGDLRGVSAMFLSIQAGAAMNYRFSSSMLSASAIWGPYWQKLTLVGAPSHPAAIGDGGRISLGYAQSIDHQSLWGLRGIKQVRTALTEDFSFTETVALVELSWLRQI